MSGPRAGSPRRFGWLRLAFSLGLLAVVCALVDWREETKILHHVSLVWVGWALALHVINRFFIQVFGHFICNYCSCVISRLHSGLVGHFLVNYSSSPCF